MSGNVSTCEMLETKKRKFSNDSVSNSEAEDLSAHVRISSFDGFQLKRVLSDNTDSKSIFLEGSFEPFHESAVILLEKLPFLFDSVDKVLNNPEVRVSLRSQNAQLYDCYPNVTRGDIKATLIYPATAKHIEKYLFQPFNVVHETPVLYKDVVLPHLQSDTFSIQWVYNILEHKSEVERIVFEDPDPETGFVLIPDLKWDESTPYLIAICHTRSVRSLRELRVSHLPLLRNLREKATAAICGKYGVSPAKLRAYLHYQPSYFHLHVHFNMLHKDMPGIHLGRAHLLDTVIANLQLCPDYYQKVTLTYALTQNNPLYQKMTRD